MKKRIVFRWVAVAVLAISLRVPALAILGIGDIVFDPTNYEQAIRQFIQLQQQYDQLVRTYQQIRAQYDLMARMARQVPVNMAARYRAAATPWRYSSSSNIYGTTGGWTSGINTGQRVLAGYAEATQLLEQYGGALLQIPVDQQRRIRTSYGTVELTDGANLGALETIGHLRGNASAVETAIQSLEVDSLSSSPDMNTEIAVLNKINAANLIAVRNTQDSNKLLVAIAEKQILDAKRQRDSEAQTINNHIRFVREGGAAISAQAADASRAMMAWRMP